MIWSFSYYVLLLFAYLFIFIIFLVCGILGYFWLFILLLFVTFFVCGCVLEDMSIFSGEGSAVLGGCMCARV